MVYAVQDSTATGMVVMPGDHDGRPDAVNMPVMDDRGALLHQEVGVLPTWSG